MAKLINELLLTCVHRERLPRYLRRPARAALRAKLARQADPRDHPT
jgi:hypothetical protein